MDAISVIVVSDRKRPCLKPGKENSISSYTAGGANARVSARTRGRQPLRRRARRAARAPRRLFVLRSSRVA